MEPFPIIDYAHIGRNIGEDVYTVHVLRYAPEGTMPDRYALDGAGIWHAFGKGDIIPVSVCELPGPALKALKREFANPGGHLSEELAATNDLLRRSMREPQPRPTRWTAIGQRALAWLRS